MTELERQVAAESVERVKRNDVLNEAIAAIEALVVGRSPTRRQAMREAATAVWKLKS